MNSCTCCTDPGCCPPCPDCPVYEEDEHDLWAQEAWNSYDGED